MGSGEVNKGIFIGIVAVVVVVAAVVGYMFLNPPAPKMDASQAKSYEQHVKESQASSNYPGSPNYRASGGSSGYSSPSSGGGSAGGSGGYSSPSSGGSSSGYPGGGR